MSSIDRKFEIPTKNGFANILIHEPSLTSDHLGLKTWAASYLLAKRFSNLSFPASFSSQRTLALEIGSGTGLVGLAAATVLGITVYLTDLPDIVGNLQRNADLNKETVELCGGSVVPSILDWSVPNTLTVSSIDASPGVPNFPLIFAADTVYSMEHPKLMVNVISRWLTRSVDARVIFELPRRPGFEVELESLVKDLKEVGLKMLVEEDETGYDDWGSEGEDDNQEAAIQCWFSVWTWISSKH
jgi:predicted nicotinamide N-methyase